MGRKPCPDGVCANSWGVREGGGGCPLKLERSGGFEGGGERHGKGKGGGGGASRSSFGRSEDLKRAVTVSSTREWTEGAENVFGAGSTQVRDYQAGQIGMGMASPRIFEFGVLRLLEIRAHWQWPALTSSSC